MGDYKPNPVDFGATPKQIKLAESKKKDKKHGKVGVARMAAAFKTPTTKKESIKGVGLSVGAEAIRGAAQYTGVEGAGGTVGKLPKSWGTVARAAAAVGRVALKVPLAIMRPPKNMSKGGGAT